MFGRKLTGLLVCILVLSFAAIASAEIPDLTLSQATKAIGDPVSVLTRPDGLGDPLSDCYVFGGAKVDATITLELLNAFGNGIPGYSRTDLWLETTANGLVLCVDGSLADADTDAAGMATFSMPIFGGGASDYPGELMHVMVSGQPLNGSDLDVYVNSPDIDGDLIVNLADVAPFAQDFYSAAPIADRYRSNFFWDSAMNLADIALFAQAIGASCP